MNIDLIVTLVSSLVISIIGIFVLFKNSHSKINFYFFLLSQFFALVTIITYLSNNQYNQVNTLLFMRLTIFFAFFVFFSLFLFSRYLSGIPINFKRFRNKILLLLAVVIIPIIIVSPLTFESVVLHPTIVPKVGPGIAVFLISDILLLFLSFRIFFNKYRNSDGYERLQAGYLFYGLISLFIIIFIFNIILPIFFNNISFFSYLTDAYPIALFILISYSIINNRLFNLKVAVRSILIYFISFVILVVFEWLLNTILNFHLNFIFFLIEIIFSLLIILIFPRIYEITMIILDKYLFKRIQNINSEIEKLLQSINSNIDANKFFDLLKSSIQDIFGISSIAFILISDGEIMQIFSEKIEKSLINDIFEMFKDIQRITVISELSNIETYNKFINNDIEIVVPIKSRDSRLLALLILGRKSSKDSYYTNDIDILEKIVIQIGIFVSNMNLYHQVLNFNTELQSKVKEATHKLADKNKELEDANEQLKSLDKLKDDLLSIASHELRTPAGIVKGNVYLAKSVIEKLKSKIGSKSKSEEFRRLTRYISRSVESIDNEIRIINTLLEASRLGREDMTMIPENIDLEDMIESQRDALSKDAASKGIKIEYIKEKIDKVFGDRAKVEEVLGNLITNAIKYSEKGVIEIKTETGEGFITVHIKDEGIGISKEDMGGLFQKFHRLNNYTGDSKDPQHLLVRPGGTGLGLYVTKGLVERMGGKIWVESTPGVGSTFSFTLPVSKVLEVNEGEFKSKDMFSAMGYSKKKD